MEIGEGMPDYRTNKTIARLAAAALLLAGAWFCVAQYGRAREDTVCCVEVQDGATVTVIWQGREERVALPGRALELRYTEELKQQAREQGVSERDLLYRAWLDREALAERLRGEYVRLAWPAGRGARDEEGRLIAEIRTEQGTVVASGSHAMGTDQGP